MDLELKAGQATVIPWQDTINDDVNLYDVDERLLDEQSDKILPCISDKNLIAEVKKRNMELPQFYKDGKREEELVNTLKEIENIACFAT